jgi:hypothetical protein
METFHMFDYTPMGVVVMLAGIIFMVLVGRHLLPSRDIKDLPENDKAAPGEFFGLRERLFGVRGPEDLALTGKTLAQSRPGRARDCSPLDAAGSDAGADRLPSPLWCDRAGHPAGRGHRADQPGKVAALTPVIFDLLPIAIAALTGVVSSPAA